MHDVLKATIVGNSATVLRTNNGGIPVELSSFTATARIYWNPAVELNWTTATETNNFGFEIERKTTGNSWEKIAFIAGNGTTTEVKHYSYTDENITQGIYVYRLKQVDLNGRWEYCGETEVEVNLPGEFELYQNYPNPFNPSTTIKFSVPQDEHVIIKLYDILGKEIVTLFDKDVLQGSYNVKLNAKNLASGIYFYSIKAGNFNAVRKMQILK